VRGYVVVDLGFGDAGKGLVTDALVRRTGARLVVRYNGGAQAGHNVVAPDGRHHTFAQVGAGSFVPGCATLLGPRVVTHPTALLAELGVLAARGVDVRDRLAVCADAPVVTPYHQALNRLRELARGPARHGSCGVGIGETVAHGLAHPDERVVAGDLARPRVLADKLAAIRARLGRAAAALVEEASSSGASAPAEEHAYFLHDDLPAAWIARAAPVARWVVPTDAARARIAGADAVVFEGAQGVLLDETWGFHPHTTWSTVTPAWARELAPDAAFTVYGVARAFAVRHGAGPLPTEDPALPGAMTDHNAPNPWQGAVRAGHFDAVLLRYALAALGGVDRLVLTHLDAVSRAGWRAAPAYTLDGARLDALPVATTPTLAGQAALGAALLRAAPLLDPPLPEAALRDADAVRARVAALLGRPVDAVSFGPRAADVAGL
jgi:adenylosuccinate synthase